jgi:hypothetical protein
MKSKRPLARQCKKLAKQYVDDPDVPAAPNGDSGYAEWVQIALILMRVELDKILRETEAWFNDSTAILDEFGLEQAPHYSSFCRWEQQFQMRELRRLLRQSAEQAGWSGEAAIDATGFQRDQTSYHYRKRADFSFQAMKTTVLIDVNSLASETSTTRHAKAGTATSGCMSSAFRRKTCVSWPQTRITRGVLSARNVEVNQRGRSSNTGSRHRYRRRTTRGWTLMLTISGG